MIPEISEFSQTVDHSEYLGGVGWGRTDFWVFLILHNSVNTTVLSTSNCEWKLFQPESAFDAYVTWRVLWFGKNLKEANILGREKFHHKIHFSLTGASNAGDGKCSQISDGIPFGAQGLILFLLSFFKSLS